MPVRAVEKLLQHDNGTPRLLRYGHKDPANREPPGAGNQDGRQQSNESQAVFESGISKSVIGPVTEEETILSVNHGDGSDHDDDDGSRGEPAQESNNQAQASEELANGHGIAERSHAVGRWLDHGRQARPTECSKELLRPVGRENDSDDQSHREERGVDGRSVLSWGCVHASPLYRELRIADLAVVLVRARLPSRWA